MNSLRSLLLFFFILILIPTTARSDDRSNARGIGLSNASILSGNGIDAYGVNPANFDYRRDIKLLDKKGKPVKNTSKPTWEISIFSLGGSYGSDSSLDFYNNYLKYLSINRSTFTDLFTDFNKVLEFRNNVLPAKRTQVNYDFELKWFSVNYSHPKIGALNFTIADRVGLNTNAYSRDEEMPLNFNLVIKPDGSYDLTNVNLNQAEAVAWWIRKYSFGYAKQFVFNPKSSVRSFSLGFTASLVHGFGNVNTYNSTLTINSYGVRRNATTQVNHVDSISGRQDFYSTSALTDFFKDYGDGAKSHFDFFPKPAGTGFSFDAGFAMKLGDKWGIAASVTDIGSITWNYNTIINKDNNSFVYKNFDLTSTDPTYNQFVNDLEGINTRDTNVSYKTSLPTKYRAGLSFKPSEKLLFEFNWVKGDNNMPGNSSDNIFGLGSEYLPAKFLPIRLGVSLGGPGDYYIAFGAGLRFNNFTIDIATAGVNQIIQNKRLSVSFASKLIF